ncbi:hypothetical protein BVG19_g1935 [[Candida] boidinii]|nr:hypothetical protein BVG19_g1935 [[Candida] boidinii]OWB51604.1 hypothetical protein B5S27_g3169 [[Candida] boidinii]
MSPRQKPVALSDNDNPLYNTGISDSGTTTTDHIINTDTLHSTGSDTDTDRDTTNTSIIAPGVDDMTQNQNQATIDLHSNSKISTDLPIDTLNSNIITSLRDSKTQNIDRNDINNSNTLDNPKQNNNKIIDHSNNKLPDIISPSTILSTGASLTSNKEPAPIQETQQQLIADVDPTTPHSTITTISEQNAVPEEKIPEEQTPEEQTPESQQVNQQLSEQTTLQQFQQQQPPLPTEVAQITQQDDLKPALTKKNSASAPKHSSVLPTTVPLSRVKSSGSREDLHKKKPMKKFAAGKISQHSRNLSYGKNLNKLTKIKSHETVNSRNSPNLVPMPSGSIAAGVISSAQMLYNQNSQNTQDSSDRPRFNRSKSSGDILTLKPTTRNKSSTKLNNLVGYHTKSFTNLTKLKTQRSKVSLVDSLKAQTNVDENHSDDPDEEEDEEEEEVETFDDNEKVVEISNPPDYTETEHFNSNNDKRNGSYNTTYMNSLQVKVEEKLKNDQFKAENQLESQEDLLQEQLLRQKEYQQMQQMHHLQQQQKLHQQQFQQQQQQQQQQPSQPQQSQQQQKPDDNAAEFDPKQMYDNSFLLSQSTGVEKTMRSDKNGNVEPRNGQNQQQHQQQQENQKPEQVGQQPSQQQQQQQQFIQDQQIQQQKLQQKLQQHLIQQQIQQQQQVSSANLQQKVSSSGLNSQESQQQPQLKQISSDSSLIFQPSTANLDKMFYGRMTKTGSGNSPNDINASRYGSGAISNNSNNNNSASSHINDQKDNEYLSRMRNTSSESSLNQNLQNSFKDKSRKLDFNIPNDFSSFAADTPQVAESRTGKKLLLQRENSKLELSLNSSSNSFLHFIKSTQMKNEYEQFTREYLTVRRYTNALTESVERVSKINLDEKDSKLQIRKTRDQDFTNSNSYSQLQLQQQQHERALQSSSISTPKNDLSSFAKFAPSIARKLDGLDSSISEIWAEGSAEFSFTKPSKMNNMGIHNMTGMNSMGDNNTRSMNSFNGNNQPHNFSMNSSFDNHNQQQQLQLQQQQQQQHQQQHYQQQHQSQQQNINSQNRMQIYADSLNRNSIKSNSPQGYPLRLPPQRSQLNMNNLNNSKSNNFVNNNQPTSNNVNNITSNNGWNRTTSAEQLNVKNMISGPTTRAQVLGSNGQSNGNGSRLNVAAAALNLN